MKMKPNFIAMKLVCMVALGLDVTISGPVAAWAKDVEKNVLKPQPISWSEVGIKAGADCHGDGLTLISSANGVWLRCAFQRLDSEGTEQGLWLVSTVTNGPNDRFRVMAVGIGRDQGLELQPAFSEQEINGGWGAALFADTGSVSIDGDMVRFKRPGLVEEYSVSMEGVRQDFIVEQAPGNPTAGKLVVNLAVTGARVEPVVNGVHLVLANSGRKIAYNRLRVTDATGRELPARIEVVSSGDAAMNFGAWDDRGSFIEPLDLLAKAPTVERLAILVNDADAVYPVRIDPTFSDADWSSMPDFSGVVTATAVDSFGNLYVAGSLTNSLSAANLLKWDGSTWSNIGFGITSGIEVLTYNYFWISALAVSGSNLYVGGGASPYGSSWAGGFVAKWNGSSWSAVTEGYNGHAGVYGPVTSLVVSGSDLFAGGEFYTSGSQYVYHVASWNGTTWSVLGSFAGGYPYDTISTLALLGGNLYAGGHFLWADDSRAMNVAKWNGSTWSALGMGVGEPNHGNVLAMAISGNELCVGGDFDTAGGTNASGIAKWNGSTWSALGSGVGEYSPYVYALAVSGSNVYAGGHFTTAGETNASAIAKWDGSAWTALGSGIGMYSPWVYALTVSGSDLYVGGNFTTAGGKTCVGLAKANLGGIVTGSPLPTGTIGTAYNVTLSAIGGTLPYTWAVISGGLPAGLILNTNGMISGTPITATNVSFTVRVVGGSLSSTGTFSLVIYPAEPTILTTSPLLPGSVGVAYYLALAASGSTLPYTWSIASGGLPAGLSLSTNGVIGGIPSFSTNTTFSVRVVGNNGFAATNTFSFAIRPAIITSNGSFGFTNGVFGFNVSGPSGSYVVIQASTNLQTWVPLRTNLLGSGFLYFSDPQPVSNGRRFYRVQLVP